MLKLYFSVFVVALGYIAFWAMDLVNEYGIFLR